MKINELIDSWMKWKTQNDGSEYTQKQLGIDSGLGESYISQLMHGKRKKVRNETLKKLANAFGVSIEEFLQKPVINKDVFIRYIIEDMQNAISSEEVDNFFQKKEFDYNHNHMAKVIEEIEANKAEKRQELRSKILENIQNIDSITSLQSILNVSDIMVKYESNQKDNNIML